LPPAEDRAVYCRDSQEEHTVATPQLTSLDTDTWKCVGRVEADLFCVGCGYNLHGLDVRRDERLDLPTVRCPECGKFHAAGIASGAGRVWLSRLASFLLLLWIVVIFAGVGLLGLWMFGMDVASVEAFSRYREIKDRTGWRYVIIEAGPETFSNLAEYWFTWSLVLAGSLASGGLMGAFLATFLWHIRRWWWILTGVIPVVLALLVWIIYCLEGPRVENMTWIAAATLRQGFFQFAGLVLGLVLGRPVARGILRVLLTRRVLQHVVFLWQVDGRTLPTPR
jgi:hypothetical protein